MTTITNPGFEDVYLPYQGVTLAPGESWTDGDDGALPAASPQDGPDGLVVAPAEVAPDVLPAEPVQSATVPDPAPEPAVVETPAPADADSQE